MGLRGPSLFCLLAALSYALAINNGEKHRASNVLDAQEGSRVGTLTSMEAGVGAEPVSVSIAAAMAVTVTVVKATKAILKALTAAIKAEADAKIRGIAHEANSAIQDILALFSQVSGDVDLRLKDSVQEIGVWVLQHLPEAEVLRASSEIISSAGGAGGQGNLAPDLLPLAAAVAAQKTTTSSSSTTSSSTSTEAIRTELVNLLRADYDAAMGFGYSTTEATKHYRVFGGVAPGLAKLGSLLTEAPAADAAAAAMGSATSTSQTFTGGAPATSVSTDASEESGSSSSEALSEAISSSLEVSSELEAGIEAINGELGSISDKSYAKFANGASFVGVAGQLAMSLVEGVLSSVELAAAVQAYRSARFLAARSVGIVSEEALRSKQEALISTCRLLHLLSTSLETILGLPLEQVAQTNLHEIVGIDSKILQLDPNLQKQASEMVYARICNMFSPLHARVQAIFRKGGKCSSLSQFYGAPEAKAAERASSQALQEGKSYLAASAAANAASVPSMANCQPDDIYDVRLTDRAGIAYLLAAGFEQGWSKEETVFNGDLNAKIDSHLQNMAGKESTHPRVLMILRCHKLASAVKALTATPRPTPTGATAVSAPAVLHPALELAAARNAPLTDITLGGSSPESFAALEGRGFIALNFTSATSQPVAYEPIQPTGPKTKLQRAIRKVKHRAWDIAINAAYTHQEPWDVHAGRSYNTPPLYVFVKYGGMTPISNIVFLPFHKPVDAGSKIDKTSVSDLAEHEKEVIAKNQPEDSRTAHNLIAPPGCAIRDHISFTSKQLEFQGLKRWGLNLLLKRGFLRQTEKTLIHRFETYCLRLEGYEVVYRVPISPMDDIEKDFAVLYAGYLWVKKRFILPSLPTGMEFVGPDNNRKRLTCPSECDALRRSGNGNTNPNAATATSQQSQDEPIPVAPPRARKANGNTDPNAATATGQQPQVEPIPVAPPRARKANGNTDPNAATATGQQPQVEPIPVAPPRARKANGNTDPNAATATGQQPQDEPIPVAPPRARKANGNANPNAVTATGQQSQP